MKQNQTLESGIARRTLLGTLAGGMAGLAGCSGGGGGSSTQSTAVTTEPVASDSSVFREVTVEPDVEGRLPKLTIEATLTEADQRRVVNLVGPDGNAVSRARVRIGETKATVLLAEEGGSDSIGEDHVPAGEYTLVVASEEGQLGEATLNYLAPIKLVDIAPLSEYPDALTATPPDEDAVARDPTEKTVVVVVENTGSYPNVVRAIQIKDAPKTIDSFNSIGGVIKPVVIPAGERVSIPLTRFLITMGCNKVERQSAIFRVSPLIGRDSLMEQPFRYGYPDDVCQAIFDGEAAEVSTDAWGETS